MSCSLSQIYCYFSQMSIWFICEVMREKPSKKPLGKNKQNRTLLNNTPAYSVSCLRVFEREVLSRLNLCRPNDTSFVFLTPMGLLEELCGRLRCESFSADGPVPFSEPPPLWPQKKRETSVNRCTVHKLCRQIISRTIAAPAWETEMVKSKNRN